MTIPQALMSPLKVPGSNRLVASNRAAILTHKRQNDAPISSVQEWNNVFCERDYTYSYEVSANNL